ncbi:flagellar hook-associated protein FlgK [Actibacterium sp. D379-3]
MSISGSLSNALSGLTASARAAEVVSANVANALTDGYGRRVLETSSQSVGGTGAGVQIDGVRRDVDRIVLADRRLSDAASGRADQKAAFYVTLEALVGLPESEASLNGRIAAFESALTEAASRPDSDARLAQVADTAGALQQQFAAISGGIQDQRMAADRQIGTQVDMLNDRLAKIADLNGEIRLHQGAGHDATALMDQRQILVDDIAGIVPLQVMQRDHGQIALYTTTGATLLEGKPGVFGFAETGTIVPEMTLGSGALSGLTLNGQPVSTEGAHSPIAGGSLAALFDQRDVWAADAQAELDAVARDLIERFQQPGLDPSQPPGAAGLFTDGGLAFNPANETGLSARLALNPVVDPAQGGDLWHLRAGLGATDPGNAGDATLLNAFADALAESRAPASGRFSGAARSTSSLASEYLSFVASTRQGAEADQSYAHAKGEALRAAELAGGVDTDQELQNLLMIENAYAANARVVQTIDDLIQTLLSI